jgi:15-cis-phytoene synthase
MSTAVQQHPPLQIDTAYAACRHIARTAAKNFYYGFLVLPRRKRDALSAVYAFMRHADDISDDSSLPVRERRQRLNEWLDAFQRVVAGGPTDDPVFMALRHAQQQFNIPTELLDKLVAGTAMDLIYTGPFEIGPEHPFVAYNTFAELYDYCYHVASVVGLVCIRIFGYREPFAEQLAEEVGVAFQLTNIIRDVKEDASMGRIYIPGEDLDRFGLTAQQLVAGTDPDRIRPLLEMQANRAREFYKSATKLLPLVDDDSEGALWTLVTIYHRLLDRIVERNYDVYNQRIRLSTAEKSGILFRGFLRRLT